LSVSAAKIILTTIGKRFRGQLVSRKVSIKAVGVSTIV
jgi:hypothetical protein